MTARPKLVIDVVSDPVCPWCYLGKKRLEAAVAARPDIDFEVWSRPFLLNDDMPREGMDRRAYLRAKFGDEDGGETYRRLRDAGAAEGVAFRFERIERMPSSVPAQRLIILAGRAGVQDAVNEALFRAFLMDGRDIGRDGVLIEIGAGAGMDADMLAAYLTGDEDRDDVLAQHRNHRAMGVSGIPLYLIHRVVAVGGARQPDELNQAFDKALAVLSGEIQQPRAV